jgi:hypothetical protein
MAELILQIIEGSLTLINKITPDEATRIKNRILDYRRAWDAEFAKGENRDDARLAELDRELRDIGQLFLATINGPSTPSS